MTGAAPPATQTIEGVVVFTDLVGFTEYTAVEGDEAALRLLAIQEQLVADALPQGARVIKELGDGLLLWFAEPDTAIATSLELQERFEAEAERTELPIWVRMGAHWGRQVVRRDDLIGHDVNVAARIVDVAAPGEVLASEATVRAAEPSLGGAIVCDELGPVVMKGIPDAVRLYRVSRAGVDPFAEDPAFDAVP